MTDNGTASADPEQTFSSIEEAMKAYSEPGELDPEKGTQAVEEDAEKPVNADEEADEDLDIEGDDKDTDSDEDEDDHAEAAQDGFASDDAKVTLEDGSVATVADLKRGTLRYADYTRKNMEVAQERKAVEEHKSRVSSLEAALTQQREFVASLASQYIPQPPTRELMDADPYGYMQAKANYDEQMAALMQLQQQRDEAAQRQQYETTEQAKARLETERTALFEAMPDLKDPKRMEQLKADVGNVFLPHYGFSQEELDGADHRMIKVIRDAIKYQKLLAKKSETKAKVESKPPVMAAGKRRSPEGQQQTERQRNMERLTKTGSFKDALKLNF
jgi:hypothetical protein